MTIPEAGRFAEHTPAMPSLTLGEFELTVVPDGNYLLDGGALFGLIPKVMWRKKVTPDADNRVTVGLNALLVRAGGKNVLIETGLGNKLSDTMKNIFSPPEGLLGNLRRLGLEPGDIHVVINSHLHFDHCGWNTVRENGRLVATFPNAVYYAPEGECRHGRLQLERDRATYLTENFDPLVASGQMKLTGDGGETILPGISVVNYPGHTRHMQAVMIESQNQTACYISDLIPTQFHLGLVWTLSFDLFPLETIESRKRFYQSAIPGKWLTVFTHDPAQPWAYLEYSPAGDVVAVSPKPALNI